MLLVVAPAVWDLLKERVLANGRLVVALGEMDTDFEQSFNLNFKLWEFTLPRHIHLIRICAIYEHVSTHVAPSRAVPKWNGVFFP